MIPRVGTFETIQLAGKEDGKLILLARKPLDWTAYEFATTPLGTVLWLRKAAGVLESSGVRLEAQIAVVQMSPRQESILALALREAVTNIVRHAGAKTCRVTLEARGDCVVLTVKDDGRGGLSQEGYGLTGMRERVAAAGGTVAIDGSNGTSIAVSLLDPRAATALPSSS